MLEVKNGRGLCSTCNNKPSCFFFGSRGPALFCELFDDCVPPTGRTLMEKASPPADLPVTLSAGAQDTGTYAGLCVNCENRRTCTHPKPVGGVWHCENYA